MSQKTFGFVLIVAGAILLILSLGADALGIGARAGIGWKQLFGAAVGLLVALGGVWLTVRKPSQPN